MSVDNGQMFRLVVTGEPNANLSSPGRSTTGFSEGNTTVTSGFGGLNLFGTGAGGGALTRTQLGNSSIAVPI
jgi:hypothetical protein